MLENPRVHGRPLIELLRSRENSISRVLKGGAETYKPIRATKPSEPEHATGKRVANAQNPASKDG